MVAERDKVLLMEFKNRLSCDLALHVKRTIVFGSRVRGEAAEDSDLDVIVLVDAKNPALEERLEDIAYQVMWDHDFKPVISLKVIEEAQYLSALRKGFSFYVHIDQEGVLV
jgi:uncharacterized protein